LTTYHQEGNVGATDRIFREAEQTVVVRTREIVPESKRGALVKVDQRTKKARLLRETRAALIGHVGGNPSVVERALIERAVWQTLRVAQYDAKVATGETLSEDEDRTHLAWVNSLSRTLARLGLKGTAVKTPSLAELLAHAAAEREAASAA
jgi:hypothetical protein